MVTNGISTVISLESGKHTEFHISVGIGGPAFIGSIAGGFAVADPLSFYHVDLRSAPFISVSPSFFMAMPGILQSREVLLSRWGSRKGRNRPTQGCFHYWGYKKSEIRRNGNHSSGTYSCQWYRTQNPPERYPAGSVGAGQRNQKARALTRRNRQWIYPHQGNPIFYLSAFRDVPV